MKKYWLTVGGVGALLGLYTVLLKNWTTLEPFHLDIGRRVFCYFQIIGARRVLAKHI
jgi:hypothetical protein